MNSLAAVVLAGGLGTRMKSEAAKHLHPLLGRRMVDWVVAAARPLSPSPTILVSSPATEAALADSIVGVEVVVQAEARGTGDAVAQARTALEGFDGDALVLSGDVPLITAELLSDLVSAHRGQDASATVLTFVPQAPGFYGRIVRDREARLAAIVEARDATEEELEIGEVNSGIYVFRARDLWWSLDRLDTDNAQGELYLTDAVRHLVAGGRTVAAYLAPDPLAAEGVNTRAELAVAAAALRDRINHGHMLEGVTITDPATTWIEPDVQLEPDSVVHPFTVLRGRSMVRRGAEIGPHAVVADAEVGEGAIAGPFCYLRPGTVLEEGAKAGAFVEIKNSRIGERSRVPHLSYIGDADVGEDTNVAAGNITANFPHAQGRPKGRTTIGRNVRTGVHTTFVAPVAVGDDAWIGAGSTITHDVPARALAIARAEQITREEYVGERGDD